MKISIFRGQNQRPIYNSKDFTELSLSDNLVGNY